MKRNTRVEVIWDDINQEASWCSGSEVRKLIKGSKSKSMGYVYKIKKRWLIISSTIGVYKKDRDFIVIPRGCIRKIERI